MSETSEHAGRFQIAAAQQAQALGPNIGTIGRICTGLRGGIKTTPGGIAPRRLIVAIDLDGGWTGRIKLFSERALHEAICGSRPEFLAVTPPRQTCSEMFDVKSL